MFILRRTVAVVLMIIAVLMMVGAGVLKTVDVLAGTPAHAADTVASIIDSPNGSQAAAHFFIGQIDKNADAPVRLALAQNRPALIRATASALRDPVINALVRDDVVAYLSHVEDGTAVEIDLRPVLVHLTTAMHAVDARIPAAPKFGGAHISVKQGANPPFNLLGRVGLFSWLLTLLGLGLAIGAVRLFVKGIMKQLIVLGIVVASPVLLLLVVGNVLPTPSLQDVNGQAMVNQFHDKVGGSLAGSSLWFVLWGLLVAGGWWGFGQWRSRRKAA
jgi:hypothetical protein